MGRAQRFVPPLQFDQLFRDESVRAVISGVPAPLSHVEGPGPSEIACATVHVFDMAVQCVNVVDRHAMLATSFHGTMMGLTNRWLESYA